MLDPKQIAKLITEDPGETISDDEISIEAKALYERYLGVLKQFAAIWNSYADIEPMAWRVDFGEVNEEEPWVSIIEIGSKWESIPDEEVDQANVVAAVAHDVVRYILNKTSYQLATSWEYDRGRGSFYVGPDEEYQDIVEIWTDDMGAPEYDEPYDEDEDEEEPRPAEAAFMSGIHESTSSLNYETLISDLRGADPQAVMNLVSQHPDSAFLSRVTDIFFPGLRQGKYKRTGRYGVGVTQDYPPWYSSHTNKLHLAAEQHGGTPITFRLDDAEAEFPLELSGKLTKGEHRMPGDAIAWASGFVFEEQGVLAIIEIQSDVVRMAPMMLRKAEDITKESGIKIKRKFPRLSNLPDNASLDEFLGAARKRYINYQQYLNVSDAIRKLYGSTNAAHLAHLKDAVVTGFADWQKTMLQILVEYAREHGLSKVRIPTARRLGRFWRGVGDNPNMKELKLLYDRELRDIAKKTNDWWVITV